MLITELPSCVSSPQRKTHLPNEQGAPPACANTVLRCLVGQDQLQFQVWLRINPVHALCFYDGKWREAFITRMWSQKEGEGTRRGPKVQVFAVLLFPKVRQWLPSESRLQCFLHDKSPSNQQWSPWHFRGFDAEQVSHPVVRLGTEKYSRNCSERKEEHNDVVPDYWTLEFDCFNPTRFLRKK